GGWGGAGGGGAGGGGGVGGPAPPARAAARLLRGWAVAALRVAARFRGGLAAVCTELCAPHPPLGELESHHWAAEAAHRLARRLLDIDGIRVVVRGTVHSGPAVWVSNHLSYLDPLVFGALTPMVAIAKAELAGWPLLGRLARRMGTLFIRRGDPHHGARVLRQALRRLAAGIPVLNFPEGTTTDGRRAMLPFRRGVFGLARRAGVPVIPVGLVLEPEGACWVGGAAFLPHYLRLTSRTAVVARLTIGRAMTPRDFPSADACAEAMRGEVTRLLGGRR